MVGKRAKVLSPDHVEDLLVFARQTRHPLRNQAMVLLSVKAGLRASEIANLTWSMVIDPTGQVSTCLELQNWIAKKGSGRVIPLHPDLHSALVKLARLELASDGPVIRSERGGPIIPVSIVCWFARAFRAVGLEGCSSHSGRRTFITRAARLVHRVGAHCGMFSYWPGTDQSRPPNATLMAIPKPSANSYP